jgi:hypothetical protein
VTTAAEEGLGTVAETLRQAEHALETMMTGDIGGTSPIILIDLGLQFMTLLCACTASALCGKVLDSGRHKDFDLTNSGTEQVWASRFEPPESQYDS